MRSAPEYAFGMLAETAEKLVPRHHPRNMNDDSWFLQYLLLQNVHVEDFLRVTANGDFHTVLRVNHPVGGRLIVKSEPWSAGHMGEAGILERLARTLGPDASFTVPRIWKVDRVHDHRVLYMEHVLGTPLHVIDLTWAELLRMNVRLIDDLHRLGKDPAFADLHDPSLDYHWDLVVDYCELLRRYDMGDGDAYLADFERLFLEAGPHFDAFRGVLVHGDFHPANLIMRGAKPVVIDWEYARRGSATEDYSSVLIHLAMHDAKLFSALVQHLKSVYKDEWRPFLTVLRVMMAKQALKQYLFLRIRRSSSRGAFFRGLLDTLLRPSPLPAGKR